MQVKKINNAPVLLTGVERSGMGLVARILTIAGANSMLPLTKLYENTRIHNQLQEIIRDFSVRPLFPELRAIPTDLDTRFSYLRKQKPVWFIKDALLTQTWQIWNQMYPNAKWVIVRRKTSEIIRSCIQTGYMRLFKDKENQELVGVKTEEEGWLWWVHQYENAWVDMIKAGLNCKTIWPERMIDGDYSQVNETLEWVGLNWNSKIVETIDPLIKGGNG